jgi:hypothetical protein
MLDLVFRNLECNLIVSLYNTSQSNHVSHLSKIIYILIKSHLSLGSHLPISGTGRVYSGYNPCRECSEKIFIHLTLKIWPKPVANRVCQFIGFSCISRYRISLAGGYHGYGPGTPTAGGGYGGHGYGG